MSCYPPAAVLDRGIRIIGLDIHRAFAEAVAWEDGRLRRLGRVDMRHDLLQASTAWLSLGDIVVIVSMPPEFSPIGVQLWV